MPVPVAPARRRWLALVEDLHRSGEDLATFARRHDLNANTLKWWVSALRREAPVEKPAFVELALAGPVGAPEPLALRFVRNDTVLEFTADVDLLVLRRVVDALC
jgi:transposase-like protein